MRALVPGYQIAVVDSSRTVGATRAQKAASTSTKQGMDEPAPGGVASFLATATKRQQNRIAPAPTLATTSHKGQCWFSERMTNDVSQCQTRLAIDFRKCFRNRPGSIWETSPAGPEAVIQTCMKSTKRMPKKSVSFIAPHITARDKRRLPVVSGRRNKPSRITAMGTPH